MYKEISIEQYLNSDEKVPVIDVRSPKEFLHAHIPGAINIPLFSDEERAIVGITYKKEGRQAAILKGLEIVGPKMGEFLKRIESLTQSEALNTPRSRPESLTSSEALRSAEVLTVHCWRGGMRSKSMATLFDFAGVKTQVIKGGYKRYRNEVRKLFSNEWNLIILGGRTGSAKTKILYALKNAGEQIIDLEDLANHKGSAFGDLGEEPQPSTEQFENDLFEILKKLTPEKRIWIEDESHLIGQIFIPEEFWAQMRKAPVAYCDFPLDERINYLVNTYGNFDKDGVINAVKKITKRLGGQHAKAALENYEAGNLSESTRIVLVYYDKTYDYGLSTRNPELIYKIEMRKIDPEKNAIEILNHINKVTTKEITENIN